MSQQDLSFSDHNGRQYEEITEAGLIARAEKLGIGGRARFERGAWVPQPYPGFAFQAMVPPVEANAPGFERMQQAQAELCSIDFGRPVLFPLPHASFHQTVVNTFSADRLQENIVGRGLLEQFPAMLHEHLAGWEPAARPADAPATRMQLIGISLFRTGIGLLGVFETEEIYQRVLAFRDYAYRPAPTNAFGLVRTRPFIAHVTLAYIEDRLTDGERAALVQHIAALNKPLSDNPIPFFMPEAVLHRYDSLARFDRHPEAIGFPL